ncbi:MAG: hypothetical protein ABSB67_15925 [Bryobacteraceae bacterium]|jgi:hypothetical protein
MSRRCWTRTFNGFCAGALATLSFPLAAGAQTSSEQYGVYTEAPRLFLRPQRLRLLRRERERQSIRWMQLDSLVSGGAPMSEPGFSAALFFAVSGDKAAARKAADWAVRDGKDMRQLALVLDWCRDVLSEDERKVIAGRLAAGLATNGAGDVASVRDRVLAAIAIADYDQPTTERTLQAVIENWWRERTAPGLRSGDIGFSQADLYPLLEIIHTLRDSLSIDLRDDAPRYFASLPLWYLASFYPAPYEAAANEFRVPSWAGAGEPDLRGAALARSAGMAMVASDPNSNETQYAQGFLMQDRFIMRDTFGAPYEFLWANPYQPGLAYSLLPLVFYDAQRGALFVRSSWDEDARWFGIVGREFQLFDDGRVHVLEMGPEAASPKPLEIGPAEVLQWRVPLRVDAGAETIFVVGGRPGVNYKVEIEDEEMQEADADRAGTVRVDLPKDRHPMVYLSAAR